MSIYWKFSNGNYEVVVGGEVVHCTPDAYERDMFIAELKLRVSSKKYEDEIWKIDEVLKKTGLQPWKYPSMADAVSDLAQRYLEEKS